jgi:hypothetical protein
MINQILTKTYQDLLTKNGLIDSGNLYKSINVHLFTQNNDVIVDIRGLDYLTYVDNNYKLTDQFVNSNAFTDEIGLILVAKTEEIVNAILEGNSVSMDDPDVLVKVNGL